MHSIFSCACSSHDLCVRAYAHSLERTLDMTWPRFKAVLNWFQMYIHAYLFTYWHTCINAHIFIHKCTRSERCSGNSVLVSDRLPYVRATDLISWREIKRIRIKTEINHGCSWSWCVRMIAGCPSAEFIDVPGLCTTEPVIYLHPISEETLSSVAEAASHGAWPMEMGLMDWSSCWDVNGAHACRLFLFICIEFLSLSASSTIYQHQGPAETPIVFLFAMVV